VTEVTGWVDTVPERRRSGRRDRRGARLLQAPLGEQGALELRRGSLVRADDGHAIAGRGQGAGARRAGEQLRNIDGGGHGRAACWP